MFYCRRKEDLSDRLGFDSPLIPTRSRRDRDYLIHRSSDDAIEEEDDPACHDNNDVARNDGVHVVRHTLDPTKCQNVNSDEHSKGVGFFLDGFGNVADIGHKHSGILRVEKFDNDMNYIQRNNAQMKSK